MSGKGSSPRPFSVSADTFASNFDAIFGKKLVYQGVEVVDVAPMSEAKAADYLIFRKDAGAKDGPTIEGQAVEQPEGLTDGKAADLRDPGAV